VTLKKSREALETHPSQLLLLLYYRIHICICHLGPGLVRLSARSGYKTCFYAFFGASVLMELRMHTFFFLDCELKYTKEPCSKGENPFIM
jgi:hypothetical protein